MNYYEKIFMREYHKKLQQLFDSLDSLYHVVIAENKDDMSDYTYGYLKALNDVMEILNDELSREDTEDIED